MEQQIVSKELFGQRFSEILNASSETTYSIADRVSLTPATISRYANGLMAPKIPTLYMIANIFHVNPLWLMGYDAPKYEQEDSAVQESGRELPHAKYREVLSEGGMRLLMDADAKLPEEHLEEIVEFIKMKQRKYGR